MQAKKNPFRIVKRKNQVIEAKDIELLNGSPKDSKSAFLCRVEENSKAIRAAFFVLALAAICNANLINKKEEIKFTSREQLSERIQKRCENEKLSKLFCSSLDKSIAPFGIVEAEFYSLSGYSGRTKELYLYKNGKLVQTCSNWLQRRLDLQTWYFYTNCELNFSADSARIGDKIK